METIPDPGVENDPAKEESSEKIAALPPRKRRLWPIEILIVLTCIILVSVGYAALLLPGPLTKNVTIVIPRGISVRDIAALLDKNGVINSTFGFRLAAKVIAADNLKAGEYEFVPSYSSTDIVIMMRDGHSLVHLFTVAEGLTSAEIFRVLQDTQIMTGKMTAIPPEGSLLPETYRYSFGDSRASLVTRMQKSMQDLLNELWAKRDPTLPLKSPQEAVVMASIVEKETGKALERPRIAGVFYNRLRTGMRLQSDPTVIYAILKAKGLMDHNLDHNDLAFLSPYNTYTSDGLPPQPICNPGRAALEAALHPEQNNFFYFVADGSGGHIFANDLAEHNQNVARFREIKASVSKGPK